MKNNPIKERYAFLEMLCVWQGHVRNSDLQQQFGISRQQARQDFLNYMKLHPLTLIKTSSGAYQFEAAWLSREYNYPIEKYLDWLTTGQFSRFDIKHSSNIATRLVVPERSISRKIIAVLTEAIRNKKRVELNYVSLSNPDWDGRIFHPHTLIKTGLRWHVRGYCEKAQAFRDLVLSRCRDEPEILGGSQHGIEKDTIWNIMVKVILAPDPRLTSHQQEVLANDYDMVNGQLHIEIRAALVEYLLKEMQVNIKTLDGIPEAQQLVLVNRHDIKQWLFEG